IIQQCHRGRPIELAVHDHPPTNTVSDIDDAALCKSNRPARHLTCDLPSSAIVEVIDRSSDSRENLQILAFGSSRLEAVGILLLNERGRKIARPPTRVLH